MKLQGSLAPSAYVIPVTWKPNDVLRYIPYDILEKLEKLL